MKPDEVRKRLVQLAEGVYVERDVLGIVEKIRDYDPSLRVKFLDPSRAELNDPPWLIVEVCPDNIERVVLRVWELDDRVLERLRAADTQVSDILVVVDQKNAQVRGELKRRFREEQDQAVDIFTSYLRSPKSRWSFKDKGKKVTLDDAPCRKAKVEDLD